MTDDGRSFESDARLDRRLDAQARAAAAACRRTLGAVLERGRPADRELAAFFAANKHLGGRDRRLIGDTVYTVLRWWGWLGRLAPTLSEPGAAEDDRWLPLLLAAAVLEPLERPEYPRRMARRLSLADTAFAACLAHDTPADRLGDFLRLIGRPVEPRELSLRALAPALEAEDLTEPACFERFLRALQTRPPVWLRVQRGDPMAAMEELRRAGLHPEAHPSVAGAIRLADARVDLRARDLYRDRRVEVQDLASQIVGLACGARPGDCWWDVCAGAGGKALHLASIMGDRGRILATDDRESALLELERRARAAGLRCIRTQRAATVRGRRSGETFDGILIDAPCTGSGAWRRNPWARLQFVREDISRHVERQCALIEAHARAVRPGGTLVYATCSVFRAENDGVVNRFLEQFPDFRLDPFPNPLGGSLTPGTLQVWPWDGDCDSLFVARFRREPVSVHGFVKTQKPCNL